MRAEIYCFKLVNLPFPPCPEEGPVPLEGVVPLLILQSNLSAADCDIPGHNPLSKEHPAKPIKGVTHGVF